MNYETIKPRVLLNVLVAAGTLLLLSTPASAVRLKELARMDGDREFRLVGYGLVVGLAGTGDSDRNRATRLSLANTLSHFDVTARETEILSRNTAAVIVTATVGSYREPGARIDVQVSSLGDARSLQGGTLVMTPLYAADEKRYALAQGPLTTGGYAFEANATSMQKNHPTVGVVSGGATLENAVANTTVGNAKQATLILNAPDNTTALRIADALASIGELHNIRVAHAGKITFSWPPTPDAVPALLARIEALDVQPDQAARLVINERTGTLVAGGNIRLGSAVISQDDLRIEINTEFRVSQPATQFHPTPDITTVTVPTSSVKVSEDDNAHVIAIDSAATVLDLVNMLHQARVTTHAMISIFQSLREAGALNAQILVQ